MRKIVHGENIIELNNISFSFGDDSVLDNINLEVHRGDYLGVIGPNGGGKTTLLKIMLGLLRPTSGKVKLFGKDISKFNEWTNIGYVSQKATQVDHAFPMTVEGVVSMGRYEKKGPFRFLNAYDRSKVYEALRHVEMSQHKDRLIGDLSGGQQQRVFLARALAGDPEMVVLDEPTSGIDAQTQEQLYELFRKLNQELHLTLVLVSHDLGSIEREATELLCIDHSVVFFGHPEEFRKHDKYRTLEGGEKNTHH